MFNGIQSVTVVGILGNPVISNEIEVADLVARSLIAQLGCAQRGWKGPCGTSYQGFLGLDGVVGQW